MHYNIQYKKGVLNYFLFKRGTSANIKISYIRENYITRSFIIFNKKVVVVDTNWLIKYYYLFIEKADYRPREKWRRC